MLEVLAIIFFIVWLLGIGSSITLGGLIHVFLLAAVVLMLVRIFYRGRPQR